MKRLFKVISTKGNVNILEINEKHITHSKDSYLSFGQNSINIKIKPSQELNRNELHLSESIMSQLAIPLFCEYELDIQTDRITLGPYIGILAYLTKTRLDSRLKDLNSYVKNYHKIGGVITAFSLDQINLEQSNIADGYLYNPEIQDWIPAENIPLPASLFNKCKVIMNDHWELLSSIYQSKMFNFPTFHKWEMYQWLSQELICKNVLPNTQICTHPRDILHFIRIHKHAYLKPIGGTFARGIFVLSYRQNHVDVQFEKNRNIIKQSFYKKADFKYFLKRILRRGDHLIQEAIPLLSSNNNVIDFRLIYIKNEFGDWENGGLFARYGKNGSRVSNLTSGGKPKEGLKALKELLPEDQVNLLYEEMLLIAKKAAEILESHLVQCGNLGFDFGIDYNHKLWIIEINNEDPDHRIATVCKRKDILYYARLQNMLFAKKLADLDSKKTPPES